jgi:hypothetical protein
MSEENVEIVRRLFAAVKLRVAYLVGTALG